MDQQTDVVTDAAPAVGETFDATFAEEWEDPTSVSLWEGDTGTLPLGVRQTLVVLLKHRFITPRSHPREWRTLVENRSEVTSRMADLFLELVVTERPEVAFKRQALSEGGDRFPTLLHDKAWSREETLVLVKLRDHVRAEAALGNPRAFIERSELLDYVAGFRPVDATDEAGDLDRARNAIANVYKTGLLVGLSTADRWEVSPAVEAMLPIEKLYELLQAFRERNRPEETQTLTAAASADESDDWEAEESAEEGDA
ncbi:MAG: DUF4194 domain-containing protein [Nocardioides sp.]|uniref:DUF4194 domain-containing protein n=1 Tax=Nocardioides sp. TaxID=35761 RepID=UPI003F08F089